MNSITRDIKPNKLGIITSMNLEMSTSELIRGSVDFVSSDCGALHEFMQELRSGVGELPKYKKEYMCLYCGTPNIVELSNCKKCGAPRSFIIG